MNELNKNMLGVRSYKSTAGGSGKGRVPKAVPSPAG